MKVRADDLERLLRILPKANRASPSHVTVNILEATSILDRVNPTSQCKQLVFQLERVLMQLPNGKVADYSYWTLDI